MTKWLLSLVTTSVLLTWPVGAALPLPDTANAMLAAINAERQAHGARPLVLDPRLARAAALHARDLARTGRLSHTGSDGSTMGERAERAGYRWSQIAENLADTRADTPSSVVEQWMRSAPHRKNLLGRAYRDLGVAHERRIWVIVLGRT